MEMLTSWLGGHTVAAVPALLLLGLPLLLLADRRHSLVPLACLRDRRAAQYIEGLPHPDLRVFGPPLQQVPLDNVTRDFDPEAYRRYYSDLGGLSDAQLAVHYQTVGRSQHRVSPWRPMPFSSVVDCHCRICKPVNDTRGCVGCSAGQVTKSAMAVAKYLGDLAVHSHHSWGWAAN